MRTKLGLAVASMTAASILVFSAPSGAAPSETDPPPDSADAPLTDASTTTTTLPPVIDGPAIMQGDDALDGVPSAPDRGTQIVINPPPSTTTTTLPPGPDYSLPANSGTGRRAVYSKSLQKVWVVDGNNRLIKEHRVSGKLRYCDPYPGEYRVFSRSRYTFAIQNPSIIWGYMVRFTKGCNGGNIGFHEIPTDKTTGYKVQSVSQLGTPLSGGCVRQAVPDAVWMWNWAYIGTKVVVLP
jgi:lipoprotein-anchoring transpeptidase ErfK/SrfK